MLGRWLRLSPDKIKALLPVGAAAAVAAAFNTPLAAVLFALEEVVGDLHAPVLGSVVLASATSWAVLRLLLGNDPLFKVPQYQLVHPAEFAVYAMLGVAGGVGFPPFLATIAPQKRNLQPYFYYLQVPLSSVFATMAPAIFGRNRAFVRCAAEKGGSRPQHRTPHSGH